MPADATGTMRVPGAEREGMTEPFMDNLTDAVCLYLLNH